MRENAVSRFMCTPGDRPTLELLSLAWRTTLESSIACQMPGPAVGPLQSAIDDSTLLGPCEPLTRLLGSLDKHHLIHIVLQWIHDAQHSPSPKLLPPQLSRRAGRKQPSRDLINVDDTPLSRDDLRTSTSSFLDLYENRRARSYKELANLWHESMSDAKIPRSRGVDRVINVDWPTGLTYSMVATLSFEHVRANRERRIWRTIRLDFRDDREGNEVRDKETPTAESSSMANLRRLTPDQLRDRFSFELQHYCAHAVFLDSHVQATQQAHEAGLLDPLPVDWCQPFTHLRVVTNYTPIDVCSTGLHILHLPQTTYCLISGTLGRSGGEVREMALTALANSVGAKQIKTAQDILREETVVEMGDMTELRGKDPLALRDILLHNKLISEGTDGDDDIAPGGGKGRAMMRGEAEDGPLTRPEKRQRDDASGLYRELQEEQQAWQESDFDLDDLRHPLLKRQEETKKRRLGHARDREANDLLGEVKNLPRLERVRYQLKLPLLSPDGDEVVSMETIRENPIELRLGGQHILAGLRSLIQCGLDAESSDKPSRGLPTWLTTIRGTRITIGVDDQGEPVIDEFPPPA